MIDFTYYKTLIPPPLTPPSEVFPIAWSVLYVLIFFSLIIYARKFTLHAKIKGYIFFVTQMILNILWVPVFFGLQNPQMALLVIILLNIFVLLTIKEFYKISKLSACLLVPYLLWIIFATYLNIGFINLNP